MKKIITILTGVLLFLLPWQTRLIVLPGVLNGGYSEYGTTSLYGTEILLWLIVVLLIVQYFVSKPIAAPGRERRLKIFAAFFILFFYILLSHPALVTLNYLRLFLEGILIFLIIRGVGERTKLSWAFVGGAAVQALLGIYQFFTQTAFASKWLGMASHDPATLGTYVVEAGGGRWLRAYGALPHPNILAGYLMAAVLLLLAVPVTGRAIRLLKMAVLPILTAGMFFTFSRGAWLALAVGLFVLLVKNRAKIAKELAVIALTVGCLLFVFWPLVLTRAVASDRLDVKSSSERMGYYSEAWTLIKSHPLLGVGLGNYTRAVHDEIDPGRPAYTYQPVHNIFVLALAELGIIGMMIIVVVIFLLRKIIPWKKIIYLAPLLIIGLFDHYPWSLYPGIILGAAYCGLTVMSD